MKDLISVAEADALIGRHVPSLGSEWVALDVTRGRVLRQCVHAERDQPPFDRVMMDGIAVAVGDGSRRSFVPAGQLLDDPLPASRSAPAPCCRAAATA